jgi:large subunit ribosomal protein L21
MGKYAIVEASGGQFKVSEGEAIRLGRMAGDRGTEVVLENVLLLSSDGEIEIGKPYVKDARVVGEIERHARGKKLRIYRYKRKKGYQRTLGHRQDYTLVRIKSVGRA